MSQCATLLAQNMAKLLLPSSGSPDPYTFFYSKKTLGSIGTGPDIRSLVNRRMEGSIAVPSDLRFLARLSGFLRS